MEEPKERQEQKPARRASPFQFSLRALFWLTGGVAVLCSAAFAMPNWAGVPLMLLLTLALPGVAVGLLAHGGANQRAFAIGAIFPAFAIYLVGMAMLRSALSETLPGSVVKDDRMYRLRILLLVGLLASVLCGLLSLGVGRAIRRHARGPKEP
jgi:hypothetical protein